MKNGVLNQSDAFVTFKPSKDDLKYISEDDLLTTEDSSEDDTTSTKPKKYNQLNPKASLVHKLLRSVKPKTGNIWKSVVSLSRTDELNSSHLSSESNSVHQHRMAKKRKHEQDSTDEEKAHQRKKTSKKSSHNISSSDSESLSRSPKRKKQKDHLYVGKNDNGHLLTSEHDTSIEENHISELSTKKRKLKKKHLDDVSAKRTTNYNEHLLNSGHDSSIEEDYISKTKLFTQKTSNKNVTNTETLVNGHSGTSSEQDSPGPQPDFDNEFLQPKHIQNKHGRSSIGGKTNLKVPHQKHNSRIYEEELASYSSLISEKLCEKNNIWILQCPRNMNCSRLENERLNLTGSGSISIGLSQYETYSYKNNQSRFTTLAVPSLGNEFHLCRIPIAGNIIIEETVPIDNNISFSIPEPPESVELPENLRIRHPLLGTDYANQPKTVPRIEKISKKKTHKRTHNDVNDDLMGKYQLLPSANPDSIRKKKKDKSRHSTLELGIQSSGLDDSNNIGQSEKKKKHKNAEDLGDLGVFESQLNSSSSVEISKKRKRKRHSSTDDLTNISIQEQHTEEIYKEGKVKRKKKKHHDDNLY